MICGIAAQLRMRSQGAQVWHGIVELPGLVGAGYKIDRQLRRQRKFAVVVKSGSLSILDGRRDVGRRPIASVALGHRLSPPRCPRGKKLQATIRANRAARAPGPEDRGSRRGE